MKNPMLLGRAEHLAKLDPEDVEILKVPSRSLPRRALVTSGSDKFLYEVRAYGDVPVRKGLYLLRRSDSGDRDQAIRAMEEAREIHRQWIAPNVKRPRSVGNRAWHERWIAEYDRVLKLLRGEGSDLERSQPKNDVRKAQGVHEFLTRQGWHHQRSGEVDYYAHPDPRRKDSITVSGGVWEHLGLARVPGGATFYRYQPTGGRGRTLEQLRLHLSERKPTVMLGVRKSISSFMNCKGFIHESGATRSWRTDGWDGDPFHERKVKEETGHDDVEEAARHGWASWGIDDDRMSIRTGVVPPAVELC